MPGLQDKVVILTGAGGSIGGAMAEFLAAEKARLVLVDLQEPVEVLDCVRQKGSEAIAVVADISDPASTDEMARQAVSSFGRIDGLINNAAYYRSASQSRFDEIDVEEWDRCFQVNVRGAWLCARAVFAQMRAQSSGKIVNIGSNTPYKGVGGLAHYVASKAAVIGLTRALAREAGEFGICVNALCPDFIPHDGGDLDERQGEMNRRVLSQRCLPRTQQAQDITGVLRLLLGPDSDFVTGQSILVNGGAYFH